MSLCIGALFIRISFIKVVLLSRRILGNVYKIYVLSNQIIWTFSFEAIRFGTARFRITKGPLCIQVWWLVLESPMRQDLIKFKTLHEPVFNADLSFFCKKLLSTNILLT